MTIEEFKEMRIDDFDVGDLVQTMADTYDGRKIGVVIKVAGERGHKEIKIRWNKYTSGQVEIRDVWYSRQQNHWWLQQVEIIAKAS